MVFINLAIITIGIQAGSLALTAAILMATSSSQTYDGLMALGPLLLALVMIPVVIITCLIAVTRPAISKAKKSKFIIWAALILNAGFMLYNALT